MRLKVWVFSEEQLAAALAKWSDDIPADGPREHAVAIVREFLESDEVRDARLLCDREVADYAGPGTR